MTRVGFMISTEVEIVILLYQCIHSTVQSVSMPSSATTEKDTKKLGKRRKEIQKIKYIYTCTFIILFFLLSDFISNGKTH